MRTVAIEGLLALSVLIAWVSVLGMLRMRDPYQRMHYISPPASLSAIFIVVAIFLQRGLKPESFKALFTAVVLIAMNTFVTHAASRAFRISEVKNWNPRKGEEVPLKSGDEVISPEKSS
jgi:monovalent cation/proton antiporter MnhG/PhaG subunit